jgi:hypothetical protein
MDNMERIEKIVAQLPEAERVDVAEWGDHPTFRVRGKNFIFCDGTGQHMSVKLTKEEAAPSRGGYGREQPVSCSERSQRAAASLGSRAWRLGRSRTGGPHTWNCGP